jgi:hypothetical protein
MPKENWQERYAGGSPEAERLAFSELARDILDIQLKNKKTAKAGEVQRTFHAKCVLGVDDAKLRVLADIPAQFRVGYSSRAPNIKPVFVSRMPTEPGAPTINATCAVPRSG